MSKATPAVAKKSSVVTAADAGAVPKKVGAASGPLDKRLQVRSNADDDDWSKWNIQELRTSMVEDRANLQARARSTPQISFVFFLWFCAAARAFLSNARFRLLCVKPIAFFQIKACLPSSTSAVS